MPDGFVGNLRGLIWTRREIENYICYKETLLEFAGNINEIESMGPIFDNAESKKRIEEVLDKIVEVAKKAEKSI